MCLLSFAWKVHPNYPLVWVSNRDEFFNRPTSPMHIWAGSPKILAGKDQEAGGTWLGLAEQGKFAALTNYRDLRHIKNEAPSRGDLILEFLKKDWGNQEYIENIDQEAHRYNGYNLLLFQQGEWRYYSNISRESKVLSPGIYGLSNHLLDTPWPKVSQACEELEQAARKKKLSLEDLIGLLSNPQTAPDEDLPSTGVPYETEKGLSAQFIRLPGYGTRNRTAMLWTGNGMAQILERNFQEDPKDFEDRIFGFDINLNLT